MELDESLQRLFRQLHHQIYTRLLLVLRNLDEVIDDLDNAFVLLYSLKNDQLILLFLVFVINCADGDFHGYLLLFELIQVFVNNGFASFADLCDFAVPGPELQFIEFHLGGALLDEDLLVFHNQLCDILGR